MELLINQLFSSARYYAGDQEALFREAHVVPPQQTDNTTLQVRVSLSPASLLEQLLSPSLQTQSTAACGAAALPGQEFICDICMLAYVFDVCSHSKMCAHL